LSAANLSLPSTPTDTWVNFVRRHGLMLCSSWAGVVLAKCVEKLTDVARAIRRRLTALDRALISSTERAARRSRRRRQRRRHYAS
jgi:hypothetical protein